LWSDWLFERVPLAPALFGTLVAAALVCVLALLGAATGAFDRLAEQHVTWWQDRDGRVSVLLTLLVGAIPAALRYHELGTQRDLEALAASNLWPPGAAPAALRCPTSGSLRGAIAFGLTGFLLLPIVSYSVDRDFTHYWTSEHWDLGVTWTWIVGAVVTFTGGVLTYRAASDAGKFARLARSLPEIDLIDRDALIPFARQGLRAAVPGVLFATFLLLNLGDEGFLLATGVLGVVVVVQTAAMLLLPLRGLRERLRTAKREELARVNAAIRGEPDALRGSPLARRDGLSVADLLAWRQFVESVPEWPIDLSTMGRFALYIGIPLFSWVASALVERALDAAIG
jgi:hypothetical protein